MKLSDITGRESNLVCLMYLLKQMQSMLYHANIYTF